jgi:chromosome segregation ATPase
MATEPKAKVPTPVERIGELENQLAASNSERDAACTSLAEIRPRFQKSETDLTARTDELIAERRAHSETRLKLQKAESDYAEVKTAHDKLKADVDGKVQVEAAKIAESNGFKKPVQTAPATKPGETAEAPDKSKLSANELIASDIKATITR